MVAEPRYRELDYWFPVPADLQAECQEFVSWLCDHTDEIDAEDLEISFEMLCRIQELEGDISAARACGAIDGYAASYLMRWYTRGGIFQ